MMFHFFLAILLFAFTSSVFARSVSPANPGDLSVSITASGNASTIGPVNINATNHGRFGFTNLATGNVVAFSSTGVPLAINQRIPVNLQSTITRAQAAAAIGRFAQRTLPPLAVGVALYDLVRELGFNASNPSGQVVISRMHTEVIRGVRYNRFGWWDSIQQACDQYVFFRHQRSDSIGRPATAIAAIGVHSPPAMPQCTITYQVNSWPGPPITFTYVDIFGPNAFVGTAITRDSVVPIPIPQFVQAINNRTTWPLNSALATATSDAIRAGESIALPSPLVSGPATTPGTRITTTDLVNNTTTTTTTTNNHTYSGSTITTTIRTNSTTVNNTTGAVINNTTTITNPVVPDEVREREEEQEEPTFQDSPLPEIPVLYTPRFPDGLIGVWNTRKTQLLDTSLFQIIPSIMPDIADGGCPQWSIPALYGGQWDMSIPCNVWYFIRLIIIITALLLARRLIFGG